MSKKQTRKSNVQKIKTVKRKSPTAKKPVKRTSSRGTTSKAKKGTKASPLHRLSR